MDIDECVLNIGCRYGPSIKSREIRKSVNNRWE